MESELIETTITFLAILITLIIPLPIEQQYRLAAIGAIVIFYIILTLFRFNRRLNYNYGQQKRLEEKINIYERLAKIEAQFSRQTK